MIEVSFGVVEACLSFATVSKFSTPKIIFIMEIVNWGMKFKMHKEIAMRGGKRVL